MFPKSVSRRIHRHIAYIASLNGLYRGIPQICSPRYCSWFTLHDSSGHRVVRSHRSSHGTLSNDNPFFYILHQFSCYDLEHTITDQDIYLPLRTQWVDSCCLSDPKSGSTFPIQGKLDIVAREHRC